MLFPNISLFDRKIPSCPMKKLVNAAIKLIVYFSWENKFEEGITYVSSLTPYFSSLLPLDI